MSNGEAFGTGVTPGTGARDAVRRGEAPSSPHASGGSHARAPVARAVSAGIVRNAAP
ncbi:hypothetical protein PV682_10000 [Streptomyces niveiscabiei]|uniref:hypothetical protein n=1 Tax=Streptomyces niveiscabiei TaxID=164115 RepID=UPI0029A6C2C6|nr:hypothetical protein [Streptomyces niveiscabiei]MDX3381782.1 hypothetical protein [Streptomyces niveiscabiei]